MSEKEKAVELINKFIQATVTGENIKSYHPEPYSCAKQCALISNKGKIDLLIELFDLGAKDIHQSLTTPVKLYSDVINPKLKELKNIQTEIENL